jgi:predicted outer membrane repeat protein
LGLRKSLITGAGISAGAALGLASTASAATFAVDTTADTAPTGGECTSAVLTDCSLRQAIDAANLNANPSVIDYITFNSGITGTITVGSQLLVSQPVYINGPGANALTISGGDATRIFNIDMAGPNTLPVGIYRLTLTHGSTAGSGGAIYDGDGVLKVNESVLSGNYATGHGGAIYMKGSDAANGTNNVIYADTISGNSAGLSGGGVYGFNSIGTLATSTVTGNHVVAPSAASHDGAGVYSYAYGYIVDSTVAGNGPAYRGGGLRAPNGMEIYSSIVADNTAANFPDVGAGVPLNVGFSLIENGSPIATEEGPNLIGQDPQLGPLQNNGGATPTMQPSGGSPVIDQGRSRFGRDQRLEPRRIDNPTIANAAGGDAADIGALELPYTAPAIAPPPPTKKRKHCKKHKKRAASAKKCKKKKKK